MDSGSLKYIPEPSQEILLPAPRRWWQRLSRRNWILLSIVVLVVLFSFYKADLSAPSDAPSDSVLTIASGTTLSNAASTLSADNLIRSEFWFKSFVVLFGGSRSIQAGDYYFAHGENVIRVAYRLTHSTYELQPVRVLIPEGTNSTEMADILAKQKNLTHFVKADFLKLAAPHEGYLFPDTYFFLPSATAQDIVNAMLANYDKRIATLAADIKAFGRPISEVITMASIVEEEARTDQTRQTIAGILWKRLDQGMPLQVDSAFVFVNGKKDSADLSASDLAIQSPYNTYINKGLPPTPISSPGLDSIRDTVHPIATQYYYYLSDKDGNMHYAVTLAEHDANKAEYLGN